jgi:hypothetical protein
MYKYIFGGPRIWIQGLMLDTQAISHLSHSANPQNIFLEDIDEQLIW